MTGAPLPPPRTDGARPAHRRPEVPPPDPLPRGVRWWLVVPVKDASLAKTRLDPPHPLSRPDLARAVARDTLEQVCRALPPEQVVVVTSDPAAVGTAQGLGARVVADPGAGLNPAVRAGLAAAGRDAAGRETAGREAAGREAAGRTAAGRDPVARGPDPRGWAVLLGDLPALRAADLVAALAVCSAHPAAIVPDADGTGTVLLTSTQGPPHPQFGRGSAARHTREAHRLDLALPRLRRDVDTAADLAAAVRLGVGRHTARALGLPRPGSAGDRPH